MIVYLDTSSLLKLYLDDEPGGDAVRADLALATNVATSAIAYPEARSAFARRRRERRLTNAACAAVTRAFDADWPHYSVVELSSALVRYAGDLADMHHLRALDAIHLASFLQLATASRDEPIDFSTVDTALNRAAKAAVRALRR